MPSDDRPNVSQTGTTAGTVHTVEDAVVNDEAKKKKTAAANGKTQVFTEQELIEQRKEQTIYWKNVILIGYLHIAAIYGFYLLFTGHVRSLQTIALSFIIGWVSALGITAGSHRFWTHRSYKAKLPLRVLLVIFQTIAVQTCIYDWARDHRVHHKFTDTDADPHNSGRGFFFSHVGWLLLRKHPEVKRKGATIDMSDLRRDQLVMWQRKWHIPLTIGVNILIPAYYYYVCGETLIVAYHANIARYCLVLHLTWILNSGAHMWGTKPYDKRISPTDSLFLGFSCFGEGWHNYHHVFPWDYKTSELSTYGYNFTIGFIDFFAKIGWAYDLKTVSHEMIRRRMLRTGDGTNKYSNIKDIELKSDVNRANNNLTETVGNGMKEGTTMIWGWDDDDMTSDEKRLVTIYNAEKEEDSGKKAM